VHRCSQFSRAAQTAKRHDQKLQVGVPAKHKYFVLRLRRLQATALQRYREARLVAKRLRALQNDGV